MAGAITTETHAGEHDARQEDQATYHRQHISVAHVAGSSVSFRAISSPLPMDTVTEKRPRGASAPRAPGTPGSSAGARAGARYRA